MSDVVSTITNLGAFALLVYMTVFQLPKLAAQASAIFTRTLEVFQGEMKAERRLCQDQIGSLKEAATQMSAKLDRVLERTDRRAHPEP